MKITNFNKIIFMLLTITFILLVYLYGNNTLIETYDLENCDENRFKVINLNDMTNPAYINEIEQCVSTYVEKSRDTVACIDNYTENQNDCGAVNYL